LVKWEVIKIGAGIEWEEDEGRSFDREKKNF